MAEWSCSGLQIRVRRFDSDFGLHMRSPVDSRLRGFFISAACWRPHCGWAFLLSGHGLANACVRGRGCIYSCPRKKRGLAPYCIERYRPNGEIGRRKGLKIPRGKPRAGSTPASGTTIHAGFRFWGLAAFVPQFHGCSAIRSFRRGDALPFAVSDVLLGHGHCRVAELISCFPDAPCRLFFVGRCFCT